MRNGIACTALKIHEWSLIVIIRSTWEYWAIVSSIDRVMKTFFPNIFSTKWTSFFVASGWKECERKTISYPCSLRKLYRAFKIVLSLSTNPHRRETPKRFVSLCILGMTGVMRNTGSGIKCAMMPADFSFSRLLSSRTLIFCTPLRSENTFLRFSFSHNSREIDQINVGTRKILAIHILSFHGLRRVSKSFPSLS